MGVSLCNVDDSAWYGDSGGRGGNVADASDPGFRTSPFDGVGVGALVVADYLETRRRRCIFGLGQKVGL